MEKQYKQTYFNLTRNYPLSLPSNCLPLSPHKGSLEQLLSVNRNIIEILNLPETSPKKNEKNQYLLSLDSNRSSRRIHPNVSYFGTSGTSKTQRLKAEMEQKPSQHAQPIRELATVRRKDIYDDHIEKFMANKFQSQHMIQQYLTNRQQFVKEACRDIEQEIKAGAQFKKSLDKKSKEKKKKLPKLQEMPSYMFRKDRRKAEDGPYLRSINHLKKAEQLDYKDRQRKQRVFRKKIHSLEYRLDKIREDSL